MRKSGNDSVLDHTPDRSSNIKINDEAKRSSGGFVRYSVNPNQQNSSTMQ